MGSRGVRFVLLRFGQVTKLAKSAQTLPQTILATNNYAKKDH
ncbi:hypothetical protein [Thermoactinomyces sp. DSM 45892]|nr:hypothetical protein [Thermoactinomyces sp. DSM 45892]